MNSSIHFNCRILLCHSPGYRAPPHSCSMHLSSSGVLSSYGNLQASFWFYKNPSGYRQCYCLSPHNRCGVRHPIAELSNVSPQDNRTKKPTGRGLSLGRAAFSLSGLSFSGWSCSGCRTRTRKSILVAVVHAVLSVAAAVSYIPQNLPGPVAAAWLAQIVVGWRWLPILVVSRSQAWASGGWSGPRQMIFRRSISLPARCGLKERRRLRSGTGLLRG